MDRTELEDSFTYHVVVNNEEQYSIWPVHLKDPPPGWKIIGPGGSKQECLDSIGKLWTDMRPMSLRKKTEQDK
jgi:MbtH protein